MILVAADALEAFAQGVCAGMGAPPDIAAEVARHLVLANLSGHDSHGVLRLPLYVDRWEAGDVAPEARPEAVRETPVSALIDGHRGFGQYAMSVALDACIGKARTAGAACAAIRQCTHIGRLGDYTERAAGGGLIAIVTVGSAGPESGLVAPTGGRRRFLGTNPWSIGIPAAGADDFIFDAATSTIAEGKNKVALAKGVALPEGVLLDSKGRPSTNPQDLYDGGSLTGLGGAVAGHKGYGLGFAAALIGALGMIGDGDPTPAGSTRPPDGFSGAAGAFVLVLDPALFGAAGAYRKLVAATLAQVAEVRPREGVDSVLHAGQPEARSREARGRDGIPIPEATMQDLARLADRFAVPPP